jgi:hypothetical protein
MKKIYKKNKVQTKKKENKKRNKLKRNTRKIRGGTLYTTETLMDDNFIITNISNAFNNRPFKYKFQVYKDYDMFNIKIDNNDDNELLNYNPDNDECLVLSFKNESNKVNIYVDLLNKCAPIINYGKKILDILKEFAKNYGYHSIIIGSDVSYLEFNVENKEMILIDLRYLNILKSGESWYNKLGFYNKSNLDEIEYNKLIINQPILELDDPIKITHLIEKNRNYYTNRRKPIEIPLCYSEIISSYGNFRELLNYILDITNMSQENKVEQVFESLYNYIKNNCDTNYKTCNLSYNSLKKISCFIDFTYELLELKYTTSNLKYITTE